jgi:uncharacterized protein
MIIWIDADACPRGIKDIIIKAALRLQVETVLVANQVLAVPESPLIRSVRVNQGFDVADQYIIEQCGSDDVVITADVPLADGVVTKGALAINPRGQVYTPESIREQLSIRNFMQEMRDAGMVTGGPKPFTDKDKHKFASAFNAIMSKKKRGFKKSE